jgi:hypothetical protein
MAPAPGDELIPDADMVFDRVSTIDAGPEQIWPWLIQLGKQRAGWYLPASVERVIPSRRRATRRVDPRWQVLRVGDRIPDYGGRHEYLEVVSIDPERALVYRSERRGAQFTWALLLEPRGQGTTALRLRFRGRLRSTGYQRRAIVAAGGFLDWATASLMLAGLRERLAAHRPGG